jgi:LuxR family maltose regulon positive regulatory protein
MEPILITKLHIPSAHPNRISRAHLIQKLNDDLWQVKGESFMRRLTLVAAPAGYGKSTLLYEWVNQLAVPIAWVTFDESDNDPARFLQYLVGSLQTIQTDLGHVDLAVLQTASPSEAVEIISRIITTLVNEIAAVPLPILLVFDDYHTLEAQEIHQAVRLLLDHLPQNLSLAIAARADPPLPLTRLRTRRQMAEVRSGDLCFSESEAESFLLQVMGLELKNTEILTLTEITEGWIAGLQMAGLALQGRKDTAEFIHNFSGRERFVIDYLFEEVLGRQPEAIQTFLLQTSILERLTGPLCDAVLGDNPGLPSPQSGQQILEYLDRAILFLVPMDEERCFYRYHRLFSDLLRHRLYHNFPGTVSHLHTRAAGWFEDQGDASAAFDHWIAAGNYQRAIALVVKYGFKFFEQGSVHQLLTWLQQFPKEITHSQPWLCIYTSWAMVFIGRYSEAETYLSYAEKILPPICEPSDSVSLEQFGHIAAVREYLASRSQDAAGIIHYAGLALKYLPVDNLSVRSFITFFLGTGRYKANQYDLAHAVWREAARLGKEAGNVLIAVNGLVALAELTRTQGKLQAAFEICQEAARLAVDERGKPFPVAAEVYVGRARLHYEWNDLQSAEADLIEAGKILKLYPGFDLKVEYNIWLSRLRFVQGEYASAAQLIFEIEESDRQVFYKSAAALLAYRIQYYLAIGDLAKVTQITDQQDWTLEDKNLFAWAGAFIAYARVLLSQKETQHAYDLLEECRTELEAYKLWTPAIGIIIIQACILDLQGDPVTALEKIQRALSLAEPEGFIRVFIDEGEEVKALLSRARSILTRMGHRSDAELRMLGYIDRLLSAFSGMVEESRARPPVKETVPPGLIDPLTDREIEVLRLIADGYSNKEIAEKLVVTVGTVKSHTSNIYGKLDVVGRTKALVKARELNLI